MQLSRKTAPLLGLATLAALALAHPASAQTTYQGSDPNTGPNDLHPNTDAANAQFTADASTLGTINTITFENAPVGYFTSLSLNANTTATTSGLDTTYSGILDSSLGGIEGYNTTPSGSHFFSFVNNGTSNSTGSITFTFSQPIDAFGADFTGLQNNVGGDVVLTFNDGSAQSDTLSKPTDPGDQFFGLTDAGKSFSSVTITEAIPAGSGFRDIFGIDQVQYAFAPAATAAPEPSTWAAFAFMGLGATALILKAKRRRA